MLNSVAVSDTNIFRALFAHRLREGKTSKENYLTSSFVYVLQHNPGAAAVIAAHFLGTPAEELRGVPEIGTQSPFRTEALNPSTVYPDITIRGQYKTGKRFLILVENKWDSDANIDQLKTYRQLEQGSRLVFISPSAAQNASALPHCDCALRWDQVFAALAPFGDADLNVASFLEFLSEHSLGPQEPLSLDQIAAYVHFARVPQSCYALACHLASESWPWDFLPAGLGAIENRHPQTLRWGRVGVEFFFEHWRPAIFAGFLLDGKIDHKLDLVDPTRGIDLILLIEADPPATRVSGNAVRLAAQRIRTVPNTVALDQDQVKSKWRKLVVQTPLAEIIVAKNTEEQQTRAIYERFAEWGRILFEDGTLESAFRHTWPRDVPWNAAPTGNCGEST